MGGCRHRSVAVGGSRKRSAAAKRRTARRVYTLHGSATWLGCSPTTGRRAAIFSNGASKINHLWSKKGSSAPVLVCGGWFCRAAEPEASEGAAGLRARRREAARIPKSIL
jgi:hypothetical protein